MVIYYIFKRASCKDRSLDLCRKVKNEDCMQAWGATSFDRKYGCQLIHAAQVQLKYQIGHVIHNMHIVIVLIDNWSNSNI